MWPQPARVHVTHARHWRQSSGNLDRAKSCRSICAASSPTDAAELIENPGLLLAYADAFGGGDDSTLVILDDDGRVDEQAEHVVNLGLDGKDAPDMLGVRRGVDLLPLANRVQGVLSGQKLGGRLAICPRIDADRVADLRRLAAGRWNAAAG